MMLFLSATIVSLNTESVPIGQSALSGGIDENSTVFSGNLKIKIKNIIENNLKLLTEI